MRKTIMSILIVWILVCGIFVGLIGFDCIGNVKAPYIPHDPFRINSNAEFTSMAGIEGWVGDGSPGNPYIIEGYDISGSGYGYCIYIGNTTVYFEVRDSYLHEASGVGSFPYYPDSSVSLHKVQNGTIANNIASSNNYHGIYLSYSSSNTIVNNNASSNNFDGASLFYSSNNTIANNTAYSNDLVGIHLRNSNSNIIANNIASSNSNEGIYISSSSSNNITNNNLSLSNDYGINIEFSSNNNIVNNNISSNNICGIALSFSSIINTIVNNTISSNTEFGIRIYSSTDNKFFHNNIIGNTFQAYDDTNNGNKWDNGYPLGGNYWSDYGGVDLNSTSSQNVPPPDGIGDTPYIIDADSQDNYPLMEPITNRTFDNYMILKQGWNLISIPLIQNNQNLTKVLEMIEGYYDAVQWYNISDINDPWKHSKAGKPFGNDLSGLNETIGFWIHITQLGDTIFIYNGTQPTVNHTIPLHPGWNMVGYPSLSNHNRTVGLNNLEFGVDVDVIQWYDAATKTWHLMGPDDVFLPGRGYWMHSKVEAGWEVPL